MAENTLSSAAACDEYFGLVEALGDSGWGMRFGANTGDEITVSATAPDSLEGVSEDQLSSQLHLVREDGTLVPGFTVGRIPEQDRVGITYHGPYSTRFARTLADMIGLTPARPID